jgi:hypothetical protein
MKRTLVLLGAAAAMSSSHAVLLYSQWGGGYSGAVSAVGDGTGVLIARDDYTSTGSLGLLELDVFRFGGGVSAVGATMRFDWKTTANVLVGSASGALPQAGNFLWTFTLAAAPPFYVPDAGYIEIYMVTAGVTGTVFGITDPPPTVVGSSSLTDGTHSTQTPPKNMAFQMEGTAVPEPGSFLAIGAGLALLAARRRRK